MSLITAAIAGGVQGGIEQILKNADAKRKEALLRTQDELRRTTNKMDAEMRHGFRVEENDARYSHEQDMFVRETDRQDKRDTRNSNDAWSRARYQAEQQNTLADKQYNRGLIGMVDPETGYAYTREEYNKLDDKEGLISAGKYQEGLKGPSAAVEKLKFLLDLTPEQVEKLKEFEGGGRGGLSPSDRANIELKISKQAAEHVFGDMVPPEENWTQSQRKAVHEKEQELRGRALGVHKEDGKPIPTKVVKSADDIQSVLRQLRENNIPSDKWASTINEHFEPESASRILSAINSAADDQPKPEKQKPPKKNAGDRSWYDAFKDAQDWARNPEPIKQ